MHQNVFGDRALPGSAEGACSAPPDPLSGLRGGEGVGKGREEEGSWKSGGKEGKGRTPNV